MLFRSLYTQRIKTFLSRWVDILDPVLYLFVNSTDLSDQLRKVSYLFQRMNNDRINDVSGGIGAPCLEMILE